MKRKVQTKMKLTALSLMAVLGTALSFSVAAETYDVVINNGLSLIHI